MPCSKISMFFFGRVGFGAVAAGSAWPTAAGVPPSDKRRASAACCCLLPFLARGSFLAAATLSFSAACHAVYSAISSSYR